MLANFLAMLVLGAAPDAAPDVPVSMDRSAAQRQLLESLAAGTPLEPEAAEAIERLWTEDKSTLRAVVDSVVIARPKVAAILQQVENDSIDFKTLQGTLAAELNDPFLSANVATFLGRTLVQKRLYDEALSLLSTADADALVDPATFLFHRAACEFALNQAPAATDTLASLERMVDLPGRYRAALDQMQASLKSLNPESLAGIAHDMKDVHRRLDLLQTDEKVLTKEQDILARLDKLIEQMENQGEGDGSSSSGGQSEGPAPTSPADDSRLLGGKGDGKVDDKDLGTDTDWGALPDKERERALQEVGRDFPGHYRDAIEQYFRKLAAPNP